MTSVYGLSFLKTIAVKMKTPVLILIKGHDFSLFPSRDTSTSFDQKAILLWQI